MTQFFDAHAERLTMEQLPAYSPDFNPIEHLWKKVKQEATHLKYFPVFTHLQGKVDRALLHFAQAPSEITVLMARYCAKLDIMAAEWRTKHFRKVYSGAGEDAEPHASFLSLSLKCTTAPIPASGV